MIVGAHVFHCTRFYNDHSVEGKSTRHFGWYLYWSYEYIFANYEYGSPKYEDISNLVQIFQFVYSFIFSFLLANVLVALIQNSYAKVVDEQDLWETRLKIALIEEVVALRRLRQKHQKFFSQCFCCCKKKRDIKYKNYPYLFIQDEVEVKKLAENFEHSSPKLGSEYEIEELLHISTDLLESMYDHSDKFQQLKSILRTTKTETHEKLTSVVNNMKKVESGYNSLTTIDQVLEVKNGIKDKLQCNNEHLHEEIMC